MMTNDFVRTYTKPETLKEKAMCFVAKILRAKVVTPLGRIMLLPKDYNHIAVQTGNEYLI